MVRNVAKKLGIGAAARYDVAAMSTRCILPQSWPRRLLRIVVLAAGLAGVAPVAGAQSQVYTVTIRPELNDLDVRIDHVADSRLLVVNLANHSPTRVRCDLRFDAAPQTPHRATRNIDPGQRTSSVLRATRRWFSVTVDVVCKARPR